ncbi:MAG: hypothetical protein MK180_00380 [Rhodobacteraceae bacterium]|nr:hypothetical protein [Paracoccaceae bacterium]
MKRSVIVVAALAALAACEPVPEQAPLPEEVAAVADPRFVATARLREDGCYWYVHDNAVETTFLPLRTRDGRPICAQTAEERAAAAAAAAS